MNMTSISIGNKKVGIGKPVFIIAEAGVNHNGDIKLARKLIDVAATSGVDAVKFQTFAPDELLLKGTPRATYQAKNQKGVEETQYEMLERLKLPREAHAELKRYAEKKGLIFLSTPFSLSDAAFLRDLRVDALKIGSTDTNNTPYLRTVASWGIPLILSTGMSGLEEIRESVQEIRSVGKCELTLLHCTTNYPTPFLEANVRAVSTLQREFNLPIGFSDHTEGVEAAVAVVALGAALIEKHITIDKNLPGPDHKASLDPMELTAFVRAIRNVEQALGTGEKVPFQSERDVARVARKSVVTLCPIAKGEIFTEKNLGAKRPGTGLAPKNIDRILGRRATKDMSVDYLIAEGDFA